MLFVWIWFVMLTDRLIKSSSKNTSNQSKALFINFLYILHNTRKVFLRHQKESGFKPIYDYHQWRMFGHKITRRFLSPFFLWTCALVESGRWKHYITPYFFLAMLVLWCQKFGATKNIEQEAETMCRGMYYQFQSNKVCKSLILWNSKSEKWWEFDLIFMSLNKLLSSCQKRRK